MTYANVVATLALFIALGGVSYAAVKLKRNSVKSKHIGPDQAKGVDVDEASLGPVPFAQRAAVADAVATPAPPAQTAASPFKRTIVVSPGGNEVAGGNNLEQAIAGIHDASLSSPVLIWVEPGTYEVDEAVTLDPAVTVQGADRGLTFLSGSGAGALALGDNTALRDLSASPSITVNVNDSESVALDRVTAQSLVVSDSLNLRMTETAAPGASFQNSSNLSARDSDLSGATFGDIENVSLLETDLDGGPVIENSESIYIEGGKTSDLGIEDSMAPISLVDVRAHGTTVIDGADVTFYTSELDALTLVDGTATCLRSYDGAFADLSNSCS